MITYLFKKWIKSDQYHDQKIREKVGLMASVVGICCNILLFIAKLTVGLMSNSIAIITDSFNNLSDSATNIITFIGYKLAAKPADKEHPFGHGRYEYLTSLIIAIIILFVGFELLQSSIDKLVNPTIVTFNSATLVVLFIAIAVKFWMSQFYKVASKKIHSTALLAASQDSLNDTLSTLAVALSFIASLFTKLPIDGFVGILVSLLILYSGFQIILTTVDELLGKPADEELIDKINKLLTEDKMIIDVHDLLIHDYGPGKLIGSAHVEVDAKENFLIAHDIVDQIERKIRDELNIMMTLHLDPIETDNEIINENKEKVKVILSAIHPKLSFHDFRAVVGPTHINLIFDVVIPYDVSLTNEEIEQQLLQKLNTQEIKYYTVLTFDRIHHQ